MIGGIRPTRGPEGPLGPLRSETDNSEEVKPVEPVAPTVPRTQENDTVEISEQAKELLDQSNQKPNPNTESPEEESKE